MHSRLAIVVAAALTIALAGPAATQAPAKKRLLFLTHAGLYKHTSLGPAERAVIELGATGGFEVTTVEGYKQEAVHLDFAFLTPEYLSGFDGLMLMTNGNLPLSDAQKKGLLDFVAGGKGLSVRIAPRSRSTTIRHSARCWAGITAAPSGRMRSPS
jgi:hypothetical protein